jgi:hypothetical protein
LDGFWSAVRSLDEASATQYERAGFSDGSALVLKVGDWVVVRADPVRAVSYSARIVHPSAA